MIYWSDIEDAIVRFCAMALLFVVSVLIVTGGMWLLLAAWEFWAELLS